MRKTIITILVLGIVASLAAAPAMAAKKKTVSEEWDMTHLPYPVLVDVDPGGCLNSTEGVHKTTHAFKAPGNGTLDTSIDGFVNDWDFYVLDSSGNVLGSATSDQTTAGAPPMERVLLTLKKGQEVSIVACNWLGGPTAHGSLTYTYK